MRFRFVLVGVIVAVLLFAAPVMGIRADSGAPVGGPVSSGSTDGTAELGFIGVIGSNGASVAAIDEGSYLWGANAGPEALPQTGVDRTGQTGRDQRAILDGIAGGVRNITELTPGELLPQDVRVASAQPNALPLAGTRSESLLPEEIVGVMAGQSAAPAQLPVTGTSAQGGTTIQGFFWDGQAYVPDVVSEPPSALPVTGSWDDGIFVPSNLPAPGETESTLGELAPSVLPAMGTSERPTGCAQFWGMTDPDGFYSHECDNLGALPGTTAPSTVPQTGVNMSGLTKENRQTFVNPIAGGVRNITEILPEELAAMGR